MVWLQNTVNYGVVTKHCNLKLIFLLQQMVRLLKNFLVASKNIFFKSIETDF